MFTLYNVISQDGFIADNSGKEEFIPDELWSNFLDLCLQYQTVVMGRHTYETIQSYEKEPLSAFENLNIRRIVVSNDEGFVPNKAYEVMRSPESVAATAPDALVSSGPTLNNYLLEHNLVGSVIWHRVPASIGEGIQPFNDEFKERLSLKATSNSLPGVTVEMYLLSKT